MSASLSRMYKKIHLKPPTITFSYLLKLKNKHKRSLTSKLFKFLLNPKSQFRGRIEPLVHILAIAKLWNNDIYINKDKNGKRLFPISLPKTLPFLYFSLQNGNKQNTNFFIGRKLTRDFSLNPGSQNWNQAISTHPIFTFNDCRDPYFLPPQKSCSLIYLTF